MRGRWFIVRRLPNDLGAPRLAVRVAKKIVKSAVARNRFKRCVREVFRHERPALAAFDHLVSLIRPYEQSASEEARRELERMLHGTHDGVRWKGSR